MAEPEYLSEQWQQYDHNLREAAEFQRLVADAIERDRIRAEN